MDRTLLTFVPYGGVRHPTLAPWSKDEPRVDAFAVREPPPTARRVPLEQPVLDAHHMSPAAPTNHRHSRYPGVGRRVYSLFVDAMFKVFGGPKEFSALLVGRMRVFFARLVRWCAQLVVNAEERRRRTRPFLLYLAQKHALDSTA
jgi:hypothetical protein